MEIEDQELEVKILANERDKLRNKGVKFTAYIFVSILGIVITLGALIVGKSFDISVPEDTTTIFAVSAISFFVLKNLKKNIEEQESVASEKYENALAKLPAEENEE